MQYGICLLSLVPCRKEPASSAEMVSQLLFGEHYTVIENTEDWLKIKTAFEDYECWISAKQHTKLSENAFKDLQKQSPVYLTELLQIIHDKTRQTHFPITIGATLPFYKNQSLRSDNLEFTLEGQVTQGHQKKSAQDILNTAFLFLNAPYLWGGKSPFGIDCSGLVQVVYKINGYKFPRDAYQQVELGQSLSFVEEAQAGDLAYFDNEEGRIVHVGILLDNEQIIHASGCVRIDKFDHYGIFNSDTKKYSHRLRVIKRVI